MYWAIRRASWARWADEPTFAVISSRAAAVSSRLAAWLSVRREGDRLAFDADSDSALSKGNIALLLKLYSGRTPQEIVAFDARAALDRLGLPSALTRQRANGLNSMVGRIREAALATA